MIFLAFWFSLSSLNKSIQKYRLGTHITFCHHITVMFKIPVFRVSHEMRAEVQIVNHFELKLSDKV